MNPPLENVARHVNWYTDPQQLLANVNLFLAQVMARGTLADITTAQQHFPCEAFEKAYLAAPGGLFTRRVWAYWGLMLLDDPHRPLPERFPGANRFDWRKSTSLTADL